MNAIDCGLYGEEIGYKILSVFFDTVVYNSNAKIDFKCYDINGVVYYIEVKSCMKIVKDTSHNNNIRSGRFILRKDQHTYLKNLPNSYYLFIIFKDMSFSIDELFFIKSKNIHVLFNNCQEKCFVFNNIVEVD